MNSGWVHPYVVYRWYIRVFISIWVWDLSTLETPISTHILGCSKSFKSDIYRAVEEPKFLRHFKISSFI